MIEFAARFLADMSSLLNNPSSFVISSTKNTDKEFELIKNENNNQDEDPDSNLADRHAKYHGSDPESRP